MSYTITLYDGTTTWDITSRTEKISISERLGADANTFKITAHGIYLNHQYNLVNIKNGLTNIASGYVVNQSDSVRGYNKKQTDFDCYDLSYLLANRVVADTYENKTIDYIVKDIASNHLAELTCNNVDVSDVTITYIQFQYLSAIECMRQIMENAYDWYWYVDADGDMHMFYQYEAIGADVGMGNILQGSFKVTYESEQAANRLWIVGSTYTDTNYIDQYFTGDGNNRLFQLAYEPNFTDIYLDDVLMTNKLEENDDGGQDFLLNKRRKLVITPDNITPPHSGVIKVHYRPTKQLIDYYENPASINQYPCGLLEKVVRNKDIQDKDQARQYGKAEIKKKSLFRKTISFNTTTVYNIGESCNVSINVNEWDISGQYIVVNKSWNLSALNNFSDEVYSVVMREVI